MLLAWTVVCSKRSPDAPACSGFTRDAALSDDRPLDLIRAKKHTATDVADLSIHSSANTAVDRRV